MISVKSPFAQQTLVTMMVVLAIGALSTTWPAIIALMLSAFLLFLPISVQQEIVFLSWTEVENVSTFFTALRRSGLLAILS